MAAEVLGVPLTQIDMVMADTAVTPPAHITAGSSTTITSGMAVKLAAEDARRHLVERAATLLHTTDVRLQGGDLLNAADPSQRLPLATALAGLPGDIVGTASTPPAVPRTWSTPLRPTLPKWKWICRAVACG